MITSAAAGPAEDQLAKLPKWARIHLAHQQREIDELKRQLHDARGGVTESNIIVDPHSDTPQLVRPGTHVRFMLGDDTDASVTCSIQTRRGRPLLQLIAGRALIVHPQSTNVVQVESVQT